MRTLLALVAVASALASASTFAQSRPPVGGTTGAALFSVLKRAGAPVTQMRDRTPVVTGFAIQCEARVDAQGTLLSAVTCELDSADHEDRIRVTGSDARLLADGLKSAGMKVDIYKASYHPQYNMATGALRVECLEYSDVRGAQCYVQPLISG